MLSARCVSCVLLCLIFFGLFQFEFLQFSSILLDGWIWRVFGFSLKLGLGFVGDLHMWVCWAFDILLCSDLFLLLHKIKSNTDSLSNCPTGQIDHPITHQEVSLHAVDNRSIAIDHFTAPIFVRHAGCSSQFFTSNSPVVPQFLICTAISHGTNSTHVGPALAQWAILGRPRKVWAKRLGRWAIWAVVGPLDNEAIGQQISGRGELHTHWS